MSDVIIREARPAERPELLALVARLDAETDFMVREAGERPPWARDLAAFQASGNSTVLVAEAGGALVGYLAAHGGRYRRNRGAITVAVAVARDWNGRGIATRLFAAAEAWALGGGAHRLELTVAEANTRARALYTRLGFVDEGCMRDALRVRGAWRDERLMGKIIAGEDRPDWPGLMLDTLTLGSQPPAALDGLAVRQAVPSDAAAYFAYDRAVRGETPFLLRTAAESLPDIAATRRFLAEQRIGGLAATFVAVAEGGIAGSLSVWTGTYARTAHEASLGMAVRREYWRGGVGTRLMMAAEAWARARGLHRLSLWVLGHNTRARRFYEAHGFEEEAVARRYALIDGRFADHALMAKLVG